MYTTTGKAGYLRTIFVFFTVIIFNGLLITGCQESNLDYPARSMPSNLQTDTVQLELGQQLFMDKCASCHGKPSEGRSDRAAFFEPPAPDFTDPHFADLDPAYLYWRIETGKDVEPFRSEGSVMPAWGAHFTEQQVWQLVAYIQSRAH